MALAWVRPSALTAGYGEEALRLRRAQYINRRYSHTLISDVRVGCSMFQRRHYIAIARVLAELKRPAVHTDDVRMALAQMFQRDNWAFDPARFKEAATPEV